MSIEGGNIKKRSIPKLNNPTSKINELKKPNTIPLDNKTYNIIVTGIRYWRCNNWALIGMAAHIEKGVSILDQVGIAQKGGAVLSHIKIAENPKNIFYTDSRKIC